MWVEIGNYVFDGFGQQFVVVYGLDIFVFDLVEDVCYEFEFFQWKWFDCCVLCSGGELECCQYFGDEVDGD